MNYKLNNQQSKISLVLNYFNAANPREYLFLRKSFEFTISDATEPSIKLSLIPIIACFPYFPAKLSKRFILADQQTHNCALGVNVHLRVEYGQCLAFW